MPVFRLPEEHYFPPPSLAEPNGLLAIGGDLEPQRLLLAYTSGIFPWYSEGQPILWFSPEPRYVLEPRDLRVWRSLRKRLRQGEYEIRLDSAFSEVIERCAEIERPGQYGTWITDEMKNAYVRLHELGYAHSAEAWKDGVLVGGLYGVCVGNFFAGESMFAESPDASKIAFVWLARQLEAWGIELIDCQVYTEHLSRFGAKEISRKEYLDLLSRMVQAPRRPSRWAFDPGFGPGS